MIRRGIVFDFPLDLRVSVSRTLGCATKPFKYALSTCLGLCMRHQVIWYRDDRCHVNISFPLDLRVSVSRPSLDPGWFPQQHRRGVFRG
jgi:hypothetical protein